MTRQPEEYQQPSRLARHGFQALGWVCLGLGSLGIILPVLPTTPFLLVAVWAFSKASPELAARIRAHPRYGPYILAWENYGVIPNFAKVLAVLMMSGSFAWLYLGTDAPLPVKAVIGVTLAAVAVYIVTRPGHIRS